MSNFTSYNPESSRSGSRPQRGMTLVELLMVVAVVVLLLAVAIPQMRPTIRENKLRDASRQINVYVARAKARAAETGQSVAVDIVRVGAGSNIATELYLAESPGAYSGDLLGATATVAFDTATGLWQITFKSSPLLPTLIPPGEPFLIRFGQRGVLYNAIRRAGTGAAYFSIDPSVIPPNKWIPPIGFFTPGADGEWGRPNIDDDGNGVFNDIREAGWASGGNNPADVEVGLPFQVFFAPRRIASTRLQLPEGTAIDLQYSGMGIDLQLDRAPIPINLRPRRFFGVDFDVGNLPAPPTTLTAANNATPIRILFTPSGDVESVFFCNQTVSARGTIHLLVGSLDQVGVASDPLANDPNPIPWSTSENTPTTVNKNLTDLSSIWVSIARSGGTVTTSENSWQNAGDFRQSMIAARSLAISSQTMGGR